jgi:hypothetical protein
LPLTPLTTLYKNDRENYSSLSIIKGVFKGCNASAITQRNLAKPDIFCGQLFFKVKTGTGKLILFTG